MGDLSKNLSRREFACRCGCGFSLPSPRLVGALQELRDAASAPIDITGPLRCGLHNSSTPGTALSSFHMPQSDGTGWAVDIRIGGISTAWAMYQLAETIEAFRGGGIGLYRDVRHGSRAPRIHVDVRNGPARWAMWNAKSVPLQEFRDLEAEYMSRGIRYA